MGKFKVLFLILAVISLAAVQSYAAVIMKDGVRVNNSDRINFVSGPSISASGRNTNIDFSLLDISRTSVSTYLTDAPIRSSWTYALGASDVASATYSYMKNSGSTASSGGHSIGSLAISEDNTASTMSVYGAEGRANWHSGNAVTSAGLIGIGHWYDSTTGNATTFNASSINAGLITKAEIYNHDESTPRNEGSNVGMYVNSNVGGAFNFGIKVAAQTSGTADWGISIGKADTRTLQVNDTTDSTDSTGGIFFGASGDTKLYRSAAATLSSDGTFVASSVKVGSGTPAKATSATNDAYITGKLEIDNTLYIDGSIYGSGIGVGAKRVLCIDANNMIYVSATTVDCN